MQTGERPESLNTDQLMLYGQNDQRDRSSFNQNNCPSCAPARVRDLLPAEIVPERSWLRDTRHRWDWARSQNTCQRVSPLYPSRPGWWSTCQGIGSRTFSREKRKVQIWGSLTVTMGLTHRFNASIFELISWHLGKASTSIKKTQKDTILHTLWKGYVWK